MVILLVGLLVIWRLWLLIGVLLRWYYIVHSKEALYLILLLLILGEGPTKDRELFGMLSCHSQSCSPCMYTHRYTMGFIESFPALFVIFLHPDVVSIHEVQNQHVFC